jgi:plastocyanin
MSGYVTGRVRGSVIAIAFSLPVVVMPLIAAPAQKRASAADAHHVAIDGTAFTPATLHVKVGDRVTWINRDPFPHTATAREGEFDSREIKPGKSWTYRATRQGEFPYVCMLHPTMTATLIVE